MQKDSKNIVRQNPDQTSLDELRALVLGFGPAELEMLRQWLENKDAFAREIGEILPEAVLKSLENNEMLAVSLMPVIEDAVFISVQKNPKAMADALFPIMGPAIRQSISDTFRKMIQSLNETLEKKFSPDRIKWRLEAMFSSKSYAEIVLLKGLQFKVNSVFLIHKESSLLIQEAHSELIEFENADMVSSMLSAVQNFIKDSFSDSLNSGDTLDTIRLQDFNVWIEDGPYAFLAVVFEGSAPESTRDIFKKNLEKIHSQYGKALKGFDGDPGDGLPIAPILQDCIVDQKKNPPKSGNKKVLAIAIAIFIGIIAWSSFAIYQNIKWNNFVEDLNSRPGVVIIENGRKSGHFFVSGMKDALWNDFAAIAKEHKIDTADVVFHWADYISLEKKYILQRLTRSLRPNSGTRIFYENNEIIFEGKATRDWIEKAKTYSSINSDLFVADFDRLAMSELDSIAQINQQVEDLKITFDRGVSVLNNQQKNNLNQFISYYNLHQKFMEVLQVQIKVRLDNVGSKPENARFAKQRLNNVKKYLVASGVPNDKIAVFVEGEVQNENPRTMEFKLIRE